jgi:hypothetical protein
MHRSMHADANKRNPAVGTCWVFLLHRMRKGVYASSRTSCILLKTIREDIRGHTLLVPIAMFAAMADIDTVWTSSRRPYI